MLAVVTGIPRDVKRIFYTARKVFAVAWEIAPRLLIIRCWFIFVGGAASSVLALILAEIERVIAQVKVSPEYLVNYGGWLILGYALAYACCWYLEAYRSSRSWYVAAEQGRGLSFAIHDRLRAATTGLDAAALEDPAFSNRREVAVNNSGSPVSFVDGFFQSTYAVVGGVLSGAILFAADPVVAAATLFPAFAWMSGAIFWGHRSRLVQQRMSEPTRRLDHLEHLVQKRDSILELRVLGAIPWVCEQIRRIWLMRDNEQRNVDKAIINTYRLAALLGLAALSLALGRSILRVLDPGSGYGAGHIFLVVTCMWQFFESTEYLGTHIGSLLKETLLTEDVFQYLDEAAARKLPLRDGTVEGTGAQIAFNDVRFAYSAPNAEGEQPEVLRGVSFDLDAAEKIALVGPNGAGKSTLLQLLLGHYPPTGGTISLNGAELALMPQDYARISALTVRELIALGSADAAVDDGCLREAARLARIDEVIDAMPRGYDTMLGREFFQELGISGERGVRLSDGQYQRLRIATVLYAALRSGRRILVFDESTSMVDAIEAELIVEALLALESHTVIFVSHRFDNVRRFPRILVVEDGIVSGNGSHGELIMQCPLYREMYSSQARHFA